MDLKGKRRTKEKKGREIRRAVVSKICILYTFLL